MLVTCPKCNFKFELTNKVIKIHNHKIISMEINGIETKEKEIRETRITIRCPMCWYEEKFKFVEN